MIVFQISIRRPSCSTTTPFGRGRYFLFRTRLFLFHPDYCCVCSVLFPKRLRRSPLVHPGAGFEVCVVCGLFTLSCFAAESVAKAEKTVVIMNTYITHQLVVVAAVVLESMLSFFFPECVLRFRQQQKNSSPWVHQLTRRWGEQPALVFNIFFLSRSTYLRK